MSKLKECPSIHDLVKEYFSERYTEMKKIFQDNKLVLDIMTEVAKYFANGSESYEYYYLQPFNKEDYVARIHNCTAKNGNFLKLYLPESKIIYNYSFAVENAGGSIQTGVIIIGYKDYLVVYAYRISSEYFIGDIQIYKQILDKHSIVCHRSEINPNNFIPYLQSKNFDILELLNSEPYWVKTLNEKLTQYYSENNF